MAPGPVQREHQSRDEPLPQRMLRGKPLEFRHQLSATTHPQLSVGSILERREPRVLEPGDLRLRERLVAELFERRPAPQPKRTIEQLDSGRGIAQFERPAAIRDKHLEAVGIDLVGIHGGRSPHSSSTSRSSETASRLCMSRMARTARCFAPPSAKR
jgi:hypothetical protein